MRTTIDDWLSRRKKYSLIFLCTVLLAAIASVDHFSGPDVSFSIFYLAPVSIASWYSDKTMGVVFSVVSAGAWLLVDLTSGHRYPNNFIPVWNATVRFGFFLIISRLLSVVKFQMSHAQKISRVDGLTGVLNPRAFDQEAKKILALSLRNKQPFSLAYIDLDNFKEVNDTCGHSEGDLLLKTISNTLQYHVREYDLAARMGGDEFAVLLPQTDHEGAQRFIERLKDQLGLVVQERGWPVTLSIGLVTFHSVPQSVDAAVRIADDAMYKIKRKGKNNILHVTWEEPEETLSQR